MSTQTARAQGAERNDRAVYAALRRVVKDRALLTASWKFYQSNFSNEPVIVVNDFVKAMDTELGIDPNQKRSLTVSLFAALNRELADLPEVPEALRRNGTPAPVVMNGHASAPAGKAVDDDKLSHEQIVFRGLMTRFTERAARKDPDGAQEIAEILAEDKSLRELPATVAAALDKWLESGFSAAHCPVDIDVPKMQSIVHQVYVAACEALGPVTTDQLLAAAVTDANALPQAEIYPPDKFL